MQKKSSGARVFTTIFLIISLIIIAYLYNNYKENYFNSFTKGEYILNLTEFKKDKEVRYSDEASFRIKSVEGFNDAMFYKQVDVVPNTSYKVSAMVKTQNIQTEKEVSLGGARNLHT